MKKLGFIFAMTALLSLGPRVLEAQDGTKPKPKAGTSATPKTQTNTPKNTVPAKTPSKSKLVKVGHPVKMTAQPAPAGNRVNPH